MRKVVKIALALGAVLATSLTIGCGTTGDKDEEKWCVVETAGTDILNPIKKCYKIGSSSVFKYEFQCAAAKELLSLPGIEKSHVEKSKPKGCIDS
ncbi:MAG: hypothetical protein FWF63_10560 [Fibromonadales bacterium]|nr:hypothetical protein [Fibromonadales bacterium]